MTWELEPTGSGCRVLFGVGLMMRMTSQMLSSLFQAGKRFHQATFTLWYSNITMENHHFEWVNPLQMAIFNSYSVRTQIPLDTLTVPARVRKQRLQDIGDLWTWFVPKFSLHLGLLKKRVPQSPVVSCLLSQFSHSFRINITD